MATLILSTVGAALGGPIGGAVGALLGRAIDGAVFAPGPREVPRLTDLALQTSTYGAAVPAIFGRTRVAGSVIWATDLIETRSRQSNGKGRGSTDTYSYSASFAVLLSARAIVRVERIWADGKLLRGVAGDMKVELGALRVHNGDADQAVDPLIASAEGSDASAWRGQAYAVFEGLQLASFGNRIPSLSLEVVADDAPVGVGTMLAAMTRGVDADPGQLIDGFAAAAPSVHAVAKALGEAFPMHIRDEGGLRLRFAPTDAGALDPRDLGARAGDEAVPRIATEIDPLEAVAATLSFAYLDPARDYQAGLQRARRTGGGTREDRIDLPVVLAANVAHGVVEAALARRGQQRLRVTVSLPWRALAVRSGDAVTLDGSKWRVSGVLFEAMAVRLDLVRSGVTALASGPAAPGRSVVEPDAPHGPTTLAVIDLPPLDDTPATRAAVAVFANGTSSGWRRAGLLASIDGGASFVPAGSTALPATLGLTVTTLPPATPYIADRVHTLEVELLNAAMLLNDADDAAMLAGANRALIGDELIQFGRATQLAARRWRLSVLWRGRRGTEEAIATHAVGSRIVLLEANAGALLPTELRVAGVTVMATGLGDTAPYPTASPATAIRAVTPLSPVRVTATPEPSGDIRIDWVRRSRAGWRWDDAVDAPLGEERAAWNVDWPGGTVETTDTTFTYTAAMRGADIATGYSTATFIIRQIGAAALSPPAMLSIDLS